MHFFKPSDILTNKTKLYSRSKDWSYVRYSTTGSYVFWKGWWKLIAGFIWQRGLSVSNEPVADVKRRRSNGEKLAEFAWFPGGCWWLFTLPSDHAEGLPARFRRFSNGRLWNKTTICQEKPTTSVWPHCQLPCGQISIHYTSLVRGKDQSNTGFHVFDILRQRN